MLSGHRCGSANLGLPLSPPAASAVHYKTSQNPPNREIKRREKLKLRPLLLKLLLVLAIGSAAVAVPLDEITISHDDFGEILRCQWHINGYYCTSWSEEYPSTCTHDCDLGYTTCVNAPPYLPNPQTPTERIAACRAGHRACMEFCGILIML